MNNETNADTVYPTLITTTPIISNASLDNNNVIFGIFNRYSIILLSAFLLGLLAIGLAIAIAVCMCKNSKCKCNKNKSKKDTIEFLKNEGTNEDSQQIELMPINGKKEEEVGKTDDIEFIDDVERERLIQQNPVEEITKIASSCSLNVSSSSSESTITDNLKQNNCKDKLKRKGAVEKKIDKLKSMDFDLNKQKRISNASIHSNDFNSIKKVIGDLANNMPHACSSEAISDVNGGTEAISNSTSNIYRENLGKKRVDEINLSKKAISTTSMISNAESEKSSY